MSELLTAHERQAKIDGLREFCDFLESHPDVPVHRYTFSNFHVYAQWLDPKADRLIITSPKRMAKAMGKCTKTAMFDEYTLRRDFAGDLSYAFHFQRDAVCTPRQVGTRQVTETQITDPEKYDALKEQLRELEEEVVVKHEPILEYDCPPSLLSKAAS